MEPTELKAVIADLGRAHEEFKATVEQQLKGKADAVLDEKINKLNDALTTLQEQKDEIEKKLNRPRFDSAEAEAKAAQDMVQFKGAIGSFDQIASRVPLNTLSDDALRAYKSGLPAYLRRGVNVMGADEVKAMSIGGDPDGGYLVTPDMSGRIVTRLFDTSPIRQYANVVTISSDRLEGIRDTDQAGAGWVAEAGTRDDSDTPQVGKWDIVAHELYAQPKVTQRLLDDASVNIEQWLADKVADRFARLEATAFVSGSGVGQPQGFCSYTTAATPDASRAWGVFEHVPSGASGAFDTSSKNGAEKLFDLLAAFKPGYLQTGAAWFMPRAVLSKIRQFKDSQYQFIWQPGLQAGVPGLLLGYPVALCEDMPALAAGSLSLAMGNMREAYTIVDRLGVRMLRDPYTAKPYVRFYTTKRVGGAAVQFEALKFMKFS